MQVGTEEEQYQRGIALQKAGRYAEAAAVYREVAARRLTVNLAANLGFCLGEIGQYPESARYLGLAADHAPRAARIRRLAGAAFVEAGDFARAERELKAAQGLAPDDPVIQLALANLYLTTGRYAEGWPLMEARVQAHGGLVPAVSLPYPEWRGEPLAGKSILVWVEQGFGDKIQMARFTANLKALGAARVTLGCSPTLTDLFSTLSAVDQLVPVAVREQASVRRHDLWTRYFSLPNHLGVSLETLWNGPYLSAPAGRRERWAGFRAEARWGGRRVGLAWQASPTGFNAAHKGLSRAEAGRLVGLGAISLDPADTGAADFADTAAIIETLDLVISIDSAVAHLAGAMGKPCWTLLPYIKCDWRWLRERTDSPWYPSMRLYRQTRPFDWTPTLDQVIADLAAFDLGPA
ncbi:MAG: tetratricopeptide repeat protein [Proteobacteria bacterium]|nr:tetratricopeptide repeat protein [Pseudomonadota bacterium]